MADPVVLYSTNTLLAYTIAETYYRQEHYVWCSPHFDARSIPALIGPPPPTSSPGVIYHALSAEVKAGDRHSSKIEQNRLGLKRGVAHYRSIGAIDDALEAEITDMIAEADIPSFRPLMYVIPYILVSDILHRVPVAERAHPMWPEFIIKMLPRRCFDVIELIGG